MKFSAPVSNLLPEVDFVARHAAGRSTIPVLSFLRMDVRDGVLAMEATGLEVWATAATNVDGSDGVAVVHAAAVLRFLRALPKGAAVDVATDGDSLSIEAGESRARFSTLPAADFPKQTRQVPAARTIDAGAFCAAVSGAAAAAADGSDIRHYLQGVYLADGHAVGTDGHQMIAFELPGDFGSIIPRDAVSDIVGLLKSGGEFGANDHGWIARAGGRTLFGRTVDGVYPDWRRLEIGPDPAALFDRDAMLTAIRVATFGTGCTAILTSDERGVLVSAKPTDGRWDASTQEASAVCPAEICREFRLSISSAYLSNVLAVMPDAEIALTYTNGAHAARIDPADGGAFLGRRGIISVIRA